MTEKTNLKAHLELLEIQDHNNAITRLAYNARTLVSDIEKLKAALDLFLALEQKLDEVDDFTPEQINKLTDEIQKARKNFLDQKLIVDGVISAERISAGSITASKIAIGDLVAR